MGALSPKLRRLTGHLLAYYCPGCCEVHQIAVGEGQASPRWQWNGDATAVVFRPSVLLQTGHYAGATNLREGCWCEYNRAHPEDAETSCTVCHSYVGGQNGDKPGMIQFLADSTHHLAGQTVPLPDFPHP